MQIYLHSLLGLAKTVFMVLTKCNAPSECFLFFFGVGVDSAGGWGLGVGTLVAAAR